MYGRPSPVLIYDGAILRSLGIHSIVMVNGRDEARSEINTID